MRIVHIVEASFAGVGRHVIDLALSQADRGHKVLVIYSAIRTDAAWSRFLAVAPEKGITVQQIDMARSPGPSDVGVVSKAKAAVKNWGGAYILHGHSSKGGAVARLSGKALKAKVIYTPNAMITMDPTLTAKKRQVFAIVEQVLGKLTHALIAVSPQEKEHAAELGIDPRKLFLVPNGIPPIDRSRRSEARSAFRVDDDAFVIGFIGRLASQKAPEWMLEVFSRVSKQSPNVVLALVGAGPMQAEVEELIQTLGIGDKVRLLGEANGPAMMPGFDLFVMTSRYEGHPYVSMEAVSAGLPIVATDVGGIRSVIEDGANGFVLPVGDLDGLTEKVSRLIAEPSLRQEMSTKADEIAPRFTLDTMVTRTLEVYQKVLNGAT